MSITVRGNPDNTTGSLLIGTNEAVSLDASGNFIVKGGSKDLNLGTLTSQSLSTNGYQKLPGGLILQWGLSIVPPDS